MHTQGGRNPSSLDLADIAATAGNAFGVMAGITGSTWVLVSTTAIDNSGVSEAAVTHAVIGGGGSSPNPLPPNVAVCTGWTIAAHYRGGHPRTYWPGVPTSFITAAGDPTLTTAAITNYQTTVGGALTTFNTQLLALPFAGVLGSIATRRTTAGVGACLTPPLFYSYEGCVVHARLDSQRRRLGKESQYSP
jgi:hypothetical protein